jgi:hypothetical protein
MKFGFGNKDKTLFKNTGNSFSISENSQLTSKKKAPVYRGFLIND